MRETSVIGRTWPRDASVPPLSSYVRTALPRVVSTTTDPHPRNGKAMTVAQPLPHGRSRSTRWLHRLAVALACLVLLAPLTSLASARQPRAQPELYYSTEVVPADECDVEPIDPAVVREAAARVYARPIGEPTAAPTFAPAAIGISWTRTSSDGALTVYVDGQPFIKDGVPTHGIPTTPGSLIDRTALRAVQDTVRLNSACFNTRQPERSIALYTLYGIETEIESSRINGADQSLFEDISVIPGKFPDDELLLAPVIGAVRISSDGTAVVYGLFSMNPQNIYTEPGLRQLDVLILRRIEGEWRIDENLPQLKAVFVASVEYRDAPTPTPIPPTATPDPRVNQVDKALCEVPPVPVDPALTRIEAIYRDRPAVPEDPSVLRVEEDAYGAEITLDGVPWTREGRLVPDAEGRFGVEPAVLDGVERTLVEDAACANAGDRGRLFALRTPDGFDRRLSEYDKLTMPVEQWRRALTVADVPDAGDARVAPVVLAAQGLSGGRIVVYGLLDRTASDVGQAATYGVERPQVWVFERVGDRWLVDREITALQSIRVPSSAVPSG